MPYRPYQSEAKRQCNKCKAWKEDDDFSPLRGKRRRVCKSCCATATALYAKSNPDKILNKNRAYVKSNPDWAMLRRAKGRAKDKGVPFLLTKADVAIPTVCPVLGIPLFRGIGKVCDNSPSLDEIIPGLGYVVGNTQVISHKANSMKSNASSEELLKFADWIKVNYAT